MAGKKASLGSVKSASSTSIQREPSTEDVTVASRPASPDLLATTGAAVDTPGPHAAAEKAQSELEEGKKRKRPELNVKDKAWEGVKRQAMKEMGGMQPSELHARLVCLRRRRSRRLADVRGADGSPCVPGNAQRRSP